MPIESAYVGEDVPVVVEFTDDTGSAVDPDDLDADGDADANVTITRDSDGTALVSSVEMTKNAVGEFEYVWDTTGESAGNHTVEVEADFSGETKITKDRLELE